MAVDKQENIDFWKENQLKKTRTPWWTSFIDSISDWAWKVFNKAKEYFKPHGNWFENFQETVPKKLDPDKFKDFQKNNPFNPDKSQYDNWLNEYNIW